MCVSSFSVVGVHGKRPDSGDVVMFCIGGEDDSIKDPCIPDRSIVNLETEGISDTSMLIRRRVARHIPLYRTQRVERVTQTGQASSNTSSPSLSDIIGECSRQHQPADRGYLWGSSGSHSRSP
ncbi:uncharacterized protein NECHADRAFT_86062 [Fusarium vanettenii 77-13-4]|uniref:Uncharacterized protein n=1 Tax=Fusarium vanettenii (strain ATCC MYA-4622 / CBS 123669 / FGSC 9596 / NRRL 45880 / 77-13-4) TaxID=660122 RepID=C7Z285_FUSV7|nr:uncharacterized protein NECHADRAFT_86062 [Fusarium vanettenii 77-13-4]EEU42129.1 predicted protein [Fusarium vanettenii 77-13-4]